VVMLQPGDCSPSRRVVSKMKTWLLLGAVVMFIAYSCLNVGAYSLD
jgi:hypothetical protein